jgi:NADH-quinone oxidoreductase subunit J
VNPILFWLFAAIAVVSACFVIAKRSPLGSALALAVNMVALAGLFAGLSAAFLFVIQLLVYAGAVVVLIVFVIMLLNLGEEERRGNLVPRVKLLAASTVCLLAAGLVVRAVMASPLPAPAEPPPGFGGIEMIAGELFTRYLLPFEIVGVLLLVGLIGAVVLARKGE